MILLPMIAIISIQAAGAAPESVQTCETLHAEADALDARIRTLQAQLDGAIQGIEQNARNGQVIGQTAQTLNWATGIASLVPGVGFAASSAGAAATQVALEGQQRATAAANRNLAEVVQELTPLGQRRHLLQQDATARGCPLEAMPMPAAS